MTCGQVVGPHPPHAHLCLFHDALFSADARHYALLCDGPAVPHVTVSSAGASQMSLLRNNSAFRAAAEAAALPRVRALRLKLRSGAEAHARLLIPPQYRDGAQESYPLLLRVAFDPSQPPGAEGVAWTVDWGTYLASHRQTVVADLTLPLSATDEWSASRDAADLRAVTEDLTSQLTFVNPKRVAVTGHGYGGQLALRLLAEKEPAVTCAVAVAPVTSWLSYGK